MSDAHLTDHEWRLKMAAEGKAIYVPGKTDEERAKLDADARRKSLRLHLDVSLIEQEDWQKAADTAATNYSAAADALDLLSSCIGLGAIGPDDHALSSTLFLLGQGMRSLAETEGAALSQLGMSLGRASRHDFDFIPCERKETAK